MNTNLPVPCPAAAIEAAAKACGTNTTNLQIGQELCLPGYIPSRCKFVIRTGAPALVDCASVLR